MENKNVIDLSKVLSNDQQKIFNWLLGEITQDKTIYEIQNPRARLNLNNSPGEIIVNFMEKDLVTIQLPNKKYINIALFKSVVYEGYYKYLKIEIEPIWIPILAMMKS